MEMNYHYNPENSFPQDGNFVACLGFMGLYYAEHILRKKKIKSVTFVLICCIKWLPPGRFWTTEDGAHYPDYSSASACILKAGVCKPSRERRKAGHRPQGNLRLHSFPVFFATLMDDNNFLFSLLITNPGFLLSGHECFQFFSQLSPDKN